MIKMIELKRLINSNKFILKTDLDINDVEKRIKQNTLFKTTIGNAKTTKKFIGYLLNDKIKLIDSSPIGVLCVVNGELKNKDRCEIHIKTKTHIAFLILFTLWITAISSLLIWDYFKKNEAETEFYNSLILIILGAILFRLMIHIMYLIAKSKALRGLIQILDIK